MYVHIYTVAAPAFLPVWGLRQLHVCVIKHKAIMSYYVVHNINFIPNATLQQSTNAWSHLVCFVECLIILWHCSQKHHRCHILKAMDPLSSFRPLTSNIHHSNHWLSENSDKDTTPVCATHLNRTLLMVKGYSLIPVVGTLTLRMSCCVGMYLGLQIRSRSSK